MSEPVHPIPEPDPLAILADPTAPMAQIMGAVAAAETLGGQPATAHIGVSAGATVDLLGLYLRRHALLSGVRLKVSQGNFDDPMGDLARFAHDQFKRLAQRKDVTCRQRSNPPDGSSVR